MGCCGKDDIKVEENKKSERDEEEQRSMNKNI